MATLTLSGYDPVVLPPEGGVVTLSGTFPDDDSTYGTITPFSVYLYPPFAPNFLVSNSLTSDDKVTLSFTAPPLIPSNAGYHEIRAYSTAKGYIFAILSPGILYLDVGDDYVGSVSSPTVAVGASFRLLGHFYNTGYTVVLETDGPTVTIGPIDPSDASTLPVTIPAGTALGFDTVKVYAAGPTLVHNVQTIEIVARSSNVIAPLGSLYFGRGEDGYHTHDTATPGSMVDGPGAVSGSATSPEIDLSAYASGYSIVLDFDQFLDVRPNPADLLKIEILDDGVVVQTVTSSTLKGYGTGHVRIDITSAAAGVALLSVRFSVDTVIVPSSGREGWFIKRCRLMALET